MEQYVGLDVSQDVTHISVVDRDRKKLWEGNCKSTPEAIGETVKKQAPDAIKIGLESGHLSTCHWHGLRDINLPAICIDAYNVIMLYIQDYSPPIEHNSIREFSVKDARYEKSSPTG